MAQNLAYPRFSAQDVLGRPLVGGKLLTFGAGTTTPKAAFTDVAGTIQHTNPIILDSRGEAVIFLDGTYKLELRDSADALLWTQDNVEGSKSTADINSASVNDIILSGGLTAKGQGQVGASSDTLSTNANSNQKAAQGFVNAVSNYPVNGAGTVFFHLEVDESTLGWNAQDAIHYTDARRWWRIRNRDTSTWTRWFETAVKARGFRAVKNGDQAVSINSQTKIVFGLEQLDSDSTYDPATSRFTLPIDGDVSFEVGLNLSAVPQNVTAALQVIRNRGLGSEAIVAGAVRDFVTGEGGTIALAQTISGNVAGDFFEVFALFSGTSGTVTLPWTNNGPYMHFTVRY